VLWDSQDQRASNVVWLIDRIRRRFAIGQRPGQGVPTGCANLPQVLGRLADRGDNGQARGAEGCKNEWSRIHAQGTRVRYGRWVSEVGTRIDHFHDASDEHLARLGVDRTLLPSRCTGRSSRSSPDPERRDSTGDPNGDLAVTSTTREANATIEVARRRADGMLIAMMNWGDHYYAPHGAPRLAIHQDCGGAVVEHLTCARCAGELSPRDIDTQPGPGDQRQAGPVGSRVAHPVTVTG
jgi:hypothetical protein